jgi:hypothetical protein
MDAESAMRVGKKARAERWRRVEAIVLFSGQVLYGTEHDLPLLRIRYGSDFCHPCRRRRPKVGLAAFAVVNLNDFS